ncbi:MAG: TonB family protein [Ferruginibacter sp.]
MEPDKNNINYTARDIQQYLSGKLSPADMHAMEKAALDDAFLAEAMEGYEGMQDQDLDKHLISIKNNFSNAQTAKVVALKPAARFYLWKVAVAILVIFGGVSITYLLTKTPENKSIAVINKMSDSGQSKMADVSLADTSPATVKAPDPKKSISKLPVTAPDQQVLADSTFIYRPGKDDKKIAKQDAGGGYADDTIKGVQDLATNNAAPAAQLNTPELKANNNNETINKPAGNGFLKKSEPPMTITRKFAAQVVGADGNPLPFANISITKDNIGTYADAKGNFRLVSADSILNIEIKSAGYVTRNFTLMSGTLSGAYQNKIVLAEDEVALKEKTMVAGNASVARGKKRRAALVPDSVINVEPEDGWNNYDTYIANNLSIPDDILQQKIHGEVEISFDVKSNGALSNVKIDKSLCEDCDEAALRAVKDGPRWKVKKGGKGSGKIKVKF